MNIQSVLKDLAVRYDPRGFASYTAEKCGHTTRWNKPVFAFGERVMYRVPMPHEMKGRKSGVGEGYCADCIGKMTIRCAWCKEIIIIGDSITLSIPAKDFLVPEYAAYDQKKLSLVGCSSYACGASGLDFAGYWIPGEDGKGRVSTYEETNKILGLGSRH